MFLKKIVIKIELRFNIISAIRPFAHMQNGTVRNQHRFCFQGKKLLLTYSQCPLSKEEISEGLSLGEKATRYCVSAEKHEDGNLHIHALVHYAHRLHTTDCRYFDISGYHPNIKSLRLEADFQRAFTYVKKDGDYITNITETLGKRAALAKEILDEGAITAELIMRNPELLFCNYSSISSWLAHTKPKKIKVDYPAQKKRHHWLYGPSNCGKTTLLRSFLEGKNSCEIPDNNDFHCDTSTEVLFADEFKGQVTVQMLNKLCDGHTQLNKKGGHTRILFPIVIICSNYSIRDCYSKIEDHIYDTLINRFNEYNLSLSKPNL